MHKFLFLNPLIHDYATQLQKIELESLNSRIKLLIPSPPDIATNPSERKTDKFIQRRHSKRITLYSQFVKFYFFDR